MNLKSGVARLLDRGGAGRKLRRSRAAETAPQPMRRKNPGSACGFSLSMGSVLSARLLDLMLAGHRGSSLASGAHGLF